MLFNFMWKNRTYYVRKSVIMNTYDTGGLNFLDFTSLNNTFKVNWIKQFFRNPSSIWNFIPHNIFSKLGGLKFVLVCNYKVEKIPLKLSNYHQQMLLAWSLIYKHNFSPHKYYIWNNRNILYKNKSLYYEKWFTNKIYLVSQLFNDEGFLLTYSEFLTKFGLPVTAKEYAVVIPSVVVMLLKDATVQRSVVPVLNPVDTPVGQICFTSIRNNNRGIRRLFQSDIVSAPYVVTYWNGFAKDLNWKIIWNLPYKFLLTNKVREVSFKIIHRYYPANHYLVKVKKGY